MQLKLPYVGEAELFLNLSLSFCFPQVLFLTWDYNFFDSADMIWPIIMFFSLKKNQKS